MIEYRLANINDLEDIICIENLYFKEPYSKTDLTYELTENPVNRIVVAVNDNKVIGFLDYLVTFNSSTIMQIAVIDEFRRQGIASSLLKKMFESLKKDSDEVVEFSTLEVRESNVGAQELYKSCGYEIITVKKQYYKDGENAIYMLKRL